MVLGMFWEWLGPLGWVDLGSFNLSAFDATMFWLSGFIFRAHLQTWRQYYQADSRRSGLALVWTLMLTLTAVSVGFDFVMRAPAASKALALEAGLPLGIALIILSLFRRNLRHPLIEVLGLMDLCFLTPVLVLTGPRANPQKVLWISFLLSAYFILGLVYVKLRQNRLARTRRGETWDLPKRLWLALVLVSAIWAPDGGWILAPAWTLLRASGGIVFGKLS